MHTSPTPYPVTPLLTDHQILEQAAEIIQQQYLREDAYCNPQATKDFLMFKLSAYEREVFAVMLLDSQHRLIAFQELFFGTIDAASVYPREVVKAALLNNAAAVIFAHNHPSGNPEPSQADRAITKRLVAALNLIEVRVLDHIVVGQSAVSLAERGMI